MYICTMIGVGYACVLFDSHFSSNMNAYRLKCMPADDISFVNLKMPHKIVALIVISRELVVVYQIIYGESSQNKTN